MRRDAGRGGENEREPRNLLHVVQVVGRVEYLLEVVDRQADTPPLGLQVRLGHCRRRRAGMQFNRYFLSQNLSPNLSQVIFGSLTLRHVMPYKLFHNLSQFYTPSSKCLLNCTPGRHLLVEDPQQARGQPGLGGRHRVLQPLLDGRLFPVGEASGSQFNTKMSQKSSHKNSRNPILKVRHVLTTDSLNLLV